MKFKKIIPSLMLLASLGCHAAEADTSATRDMSFIYYPINDQSHSGKLYFGKRSFSGDVKVSFHRFQEVVIEECDELRSFYDVRNCKINAFFAADKNTRQAMIKTIVDQYITFPTASLVTLRVDWFPENFSRPERSL